MPNIILETKYLDAEPTVSTFSHVYNKIKALPELPMNTVYWLDILTEKLVALQSTYSTKKSEILEKHAVSTTIDEDGNTFHEFGDNADQVRKEVMALMAETVDLGITKLQVPASWREKSPVNADEFYVIKTLFDVSFLEEVKDV